jgi:formate dehydrogenase subunit gamma
MVLAFVLLALRVWRDNFLTRDDRGWLRDGRKVVRNEEESLPPVGRYNAGQKLLFWVLVGCLLALLLSGLLIWRAYFSHFFPIGIIRFSSVAHAVAGLLMVVAIVVHVYAAIWVKGSVRAMTRGRVSYGWAWKHHRSWFRQVVGGERQDH